MSKCTNYKAKRRTLNLRKMWVYCTYARIMACPSPKIGLYLILWPFPVYFRPTAEIIRIFFVGLFKEFSAYLALFIGLFKELSFLL